MISREQVTDKHWLMQRYHEHWGNKNICVWGWRKENVKKIKIKNPLSWAKLCNEWEGVGWRILILSSRKPERDLLHTLHLNEPSASSCWCCIASSVINSRTTPSTRCLSLPALAWGQKAADEGRWIQNSDRSLALFLLCCSKNLIEKDCDEPSNHRLDKVELLEGAKGGEGLEHVADLVAHTAHLLLSVTSSFFVL